MASNKTYTVVKDGDTLKELKTLAAAKKLADTEGAEVLCDGECVYQGAVAAAEDTVTDTVEDTPAKKPTHTRPESYILLSRMNIRKAPSMDAEILGTAMKGTEVRVTSVENDWLHLANGTFILYGGGKFAFNLSACDGNLPEEVRRIFV